MQNDSLPMAATTGLPDLEGVVAGAEVLVGHGEAVGAGFGGGEDEGFIAGGAGAVVGLGGPVVVEAAAVESPSLGT